MIRYKVYGGSTRAWGLLCVCLTHNGHVLTDSRDRVHM